jgi:hypothetical protein
LLIDEQEARHMPTRSPIDCRHQEKRLRDDTPRCDIEIRIQQPRQL